MDVYDEVDRRETDAGAFLWQGCPTGNLSTPTPLAFAVLGSKMKPRSKGVSGGEGGIWGRAGALRTRPLPLLAPTVWLATQNHSTLVTETTVVPFLPVNPEYSSTRNQVRIFSGLWQLPGEASTPSFPQLKNGSGHPFGPCESIGPLIRPIRGGEGTQCQSSHAKLPLEMGSEFKREEGESESAARRG